MFVLHMDTKSSLEIQLEEPKSAVNNSPSGFDQQEITHLQGRLLHHGCLLFLHAAAAAGAAKAVL